MLVTAGFSEFMIKKGQSSDQIQDHNRRAERDHPEASRSGVSPILSLKLH
jgi:hypothetical protein